MDDAKLLSVTALRRRSTSPLTGRRAKGPLQVWAGRPGPHEQRVEEEQQAAVSLASLKSIGKGGLPAVGKTEKTKFYNLLMRKSQEQLDDDGPVPGSPKKKKPLKKAPNATVAEHSAAPSSSASKGSPPQQQPRSSVSPPDGSGASGIRRRPASVASSSPSKVSQKARVSAAAAFAATTADIDDNNGNSRARTAAATANRDRARGQVGPMESSASVPSLSGNQEQEQEREVESFARVTGAALTRAHRVLSQQHALSNRDESLTRLQLMQDADVMVSNLPLTYLYSRPELRHYAVAKAGAVFFRLCLKKAAEECRRALAVWRNPPEVVMNEVQVGFMVIAKRLEALLFRVLRVKFEHWSKLYSVRFLAARDAFRNQTAIDIQRWYRLKRALRKEPMKLFVEAVQVCLQRRRAIKYAIELEILRRRAQQKVLHTILSRRRRYFAARSITRVKHWLDVYRKTTWRLTRLRASRMVQRWWRMILCRPNSDRELIRFIVRIGGVSRVLPRVQALPPKFLRMGFLHSMNMLASMLQRAWLTAKGQLALFMIMAAKRAKAEYEKMLNDNATVIQQNFRAYLWNKLNAVAIIWNRARRIQRGYRAYQYRCWMHSRMAYRYQRYVRFIQAKVRRWITRRILMYRFKARKAVLIFTRAKKSMCANMIQRCYRGYKERERIRIALLKAMIADMRAKADVVIKSVSKIQRNFRQCKLLDRKGNGKMFPKHVRLIIEKIVRSRKLFLHAKAKIIQDQVKIFIPLQIRKRHKFLRAKANVIWRFAKCYLLKLAIFDRIEARKLKEKNASNAMKRNFRKFLFRRKIYLRGRIRGVQRRHIAELHAHATYIQRWVRRKRIEYWVLPVRKAARMNLARRREAEIVRRAEARLSRAVPFIVRLFRPWPIWTRFLLRVAEERRYYLERISAKKMQRFARRVVAWARFDRVVAYRRRQIALSFRDPFYSHAANIIGHYWKRYKEKFSLGQRFKLRRLMIEEWNRLEANRLVAIEDKKKAEEAKRITDENMTATIKASWKQGADALTGKNYFYNYVTGETSWEPPDDWKAPVSDIWMRQIDEKGNVYYYNMKTQESQWLPPCNICGEIGEKYCTECSVAYCEKDYELYHLGAMAESEEWADHKWSLTEYSQDILKPGEVYCVECKKRMATVVCTTCWDNYCKVCFNYTHHTGALKYHKGVSYQKARKGWTVRKATVAGELDFYINGQNGETTFEKPEDLMTPEELLYYTNFKAHEKACNEHVETIKKLQFDLEAIAYERDTIIERALKEGTNIGDIMAKRKKKANRFAQETNVVDVVAEVAKKTKPGYKLFSTTFAEYRQNLLFPKPRQRGAQKAEFINKLLSSEGTNSPPGGKKK